MAENTWDRPIKNTLRNYKGEFLSGLSKKIGKDRMFLLSLPSPEAILEIFSAKKGLVDPKNMVLVEYNIDNYRMLLDTVRKHLPGATCFHGGMDSCSYLINKEVSFLDNDNCGPAVWRNFKIIFDLLEEGKFAKEGGLACTFEKGREHPGEIKAALLKDPDLAKSLGLSKVGDRASTIESAIYRERFIPRMLGRKFAKHGYRLKAHNDLAWVYREGKGVRLYQWLFHFERCEKKSIAAFRANFIRPQVKDIIISKLEGA